MDQSSPSTHENDAPDAQAAGESTERLERGTYEIIRGRLESHAKDLLNRLEDLNSERRNVFGSIETKLLSSERITTDNNCVPRDMVPIGDRFLFGYNVHIGLRSETRVEDVFAVHHLSSAAAESGLFRRDTLALIDDTQFQTDFRDLYRYYKKTQFAKFFVRAPHLYMVFRVGKTAADIKAFKWLISDEGLEYVDCRSEHEVRYPPQHEFEWQRTHRDLHRSGEHPHISVEDRLFVETVGGDLTIKIEDNTETGQGIYAEDVDDPDQTLDDAEIFYAIVGNLILLKIRPYQETDFRYIAYSEKIQKAMRLDSLRDACVLLPQGHGLIFSNGYYLQNGECKTFDNQITGLKFERRIAAPNGEDFLYVFYNPETGTYVLLLYNLIEQRVETPIICNGYSVFDDGRQLFFKAGEEPQKHHTLQVWQTPLTATEFATPATSDSLLFKIGNQEIVQAMAECHEIAALATREDSYANLYVDLVKKTGDLLDSFFWLADTDAHSLAEPIREIKTAAAAAVDEFDRVVRIRRETRQSLDATKDQATEVVRDIQSQRFETIADFVTSLSRLRMLRGHIIGLKDLKYIDLTTVDQLETEISGHQEKLAHGAVEFLLRDDALKPYEQKIESLHATVETVEKVTDGKQLEEEVDQSATDLEMLVDVVSNLKIDDTTKRTEIIDRISAVFSHVHQTRAALRSRIKDLLSTEGEAEFHSQLKLLGQSVANYLDVCDTPERCDEYLTKLMVQIEELEGRFVEFDELLVTLAEKRDEIYSAFDGKKVALIEARNRRATNLLKAAERILNGIRTRVGAMSDVDEIHSYFAADLMVDKVRDIVAQLVELGDSVKVDDIQSRMKTVQDDAIRQLKDRQELFVDGDNIIQFGEHKFSVNTQPLDLTTVVKDKALCFHLTGTNFVEPIEDEQIIAARSLWDQTTIAENSDVYRAEFLAFQLLPEAEAASEGGEGLLPLVHQAISTRHAEGYLKGVHDQDTIKILEALLATRRHLGPLQTNPMARALALVAENAWRDDEPAQRLKSESANLGIASVAFPEAPLHDSREKLRGEIACMVSGWLESTGSIFSSELVTGAAAHLMAAWSEQRCVAVASTSESTVARLKQQLSRKGKWEQLQKSLQSQNGHSPIDRLRMALVWMKALPQDDGVRLTDGQLMESAAVLASPQDSFQSVEEGSGTQSLTGMLGDHPRIQSGEYALDYHEFMRRLDAYVSDVVPQFEALHQQKQALLAARRDELRLNEFRPQVLTSFVRNRLIDQVYLPMIGDNLAKQMGSAGEDKRTDRMGLLLLISPPGYGKTTLMEYVANRLGLTFVKVNGPAIGHHVTSLDPSEAPHASARSEIEKLNLALEMGDNVMIYVDDIQHCNPEFLQKFISLCDAQRKIEGVFRGRARTYDLRGRKVAVVMAGNPYTESGQRFTIPDMLANRADTYNLGDVIGNSQNVFELSYLENALTSNEVLRPLAQRSQKDVHAIIDLASRSGGELSQPLEGSYSAEQVNEFVAVMQKLMRVRDVVLAVNDQYIASAAQADEYRTEPPFKLQGSYRDMNKLAERLVPIMNDDELQLAIQSHYENQAQTLTSGAEANLLKLKEMLHRQTNEEAERWKNIKRTFARNLLLGQAGGDDRFAQVVAQLGALSDGMTAIGESVQSAASEFANQRVEPSHDDDDATHLQAALAHLAKVGVTLDKINRTLESATDRSEELDDESERQVVHRVPRVFMDVIQSQFAVMKSWIAPLAKKGDGKEAQELQSRLADAKQRYQELLDKMERAESQ